MAGSNPKRLRILTYMCPDLPLDTFTLLRDCVEDSTGMEADLIVEDRFSGPEPTRADPFSEDLADIVIVCSTDYGRMRQNASVQLCAAGAVHTHPLASDRPVFFSEIIVNTINKDKFKSIKHLKGCSWGYKSESSLSGNVIVLNYLKDNLSTNAAFFGSIVETGSHLNTIKMVRDYTVEAAAVDSSVLAGYLREHPEDVSKFTSLQSLGPLPVYPILFNSRLPDNLKEKITDALLSMCTSVKWAERLHSVGITKFTSVDPDMYSMEDEIRINTKDMKMNTAYY